MKTLNFLLVLVTLFIVSDLRAGENDWARVSSGISEDGLDGINFVSTEIGFICGTRGVMLKTSNGGNSWELKNTGLSSGLIFVYFLNNQTGIAGGSFGKIIRTTDGGSTWTQIPSGTSSGLHSIYFVDPNTGYISGSDLALLKTSNSGQSWEKIGTTGIGAYHDIYFPNVLNGITINSYTVRKTTNGGVNWTVLHTAPMDLRAMYFTNASTGFIGGFGGGIQRTTDGGTSWSTSALGTELSVLKIEFAGNSGYAVGVSNIGRGFIAKTDDAGLNWEIDASNLSSIYDLARNNGYIWAVGDSGTIYRSVNPIGINQISSEVPKGFSLKQNYPNPFNPVTIIEFSIPTSGNVKLTIFDISGKTIEVLVNKDLSAGVYKYDFEATNLSSGIYFYRIESNDYVETKKMSLIK